MPVVMPRVAVKITKELSMKRAAHRGFERLVSDQCRETTKHTRKLRARQTPDGAKRRSWARGVPRAATSDAATAGVSME